MSVARLNRRTKGVSSLSIVAMSAVGIALAGCGGSSAQHTNTSTLKAQPTPIASGADAPPGPAATAHAASRAREQAAQIKADRGARSSKAGRTPTRSRSHAPLRARPTTNTTRRVRSSRIHARSFSAQKRKRSWAGRRPPASRRHWARPASIGSSARRAASRCPCRRLSSLRSPTR